MCKSHLQSQTFYTPEEHKQHKQRGGEGTVWGRALVREMRRQGRMMLRRFPQMMKNNSSRTSLVPARPIAHLFFPSHTYNYKFCEMITTTFTQLEFFLPFFVCCFFILTISQIPPQKKTNNNNNNNNNASRNPANSKIRETGFES